MKELNFDCVVIGAGAAGMAAALEVSKNGYKVAVIDREPNAGGILLQCIHNGFGLHEFCEQLTGPEYAQRFYSLVESSKIDLFFNTTVMKIQSIDEQHLLTCVSKEFGVMLIKSRTVILAMGCRERNRGNIGTAGDRPSGIFTAGLAQRLINIDGYIPGKNVVIVGSGDIGLIMARRLTWSGCKVHAVVEIQPFPAGLNRNIVQCLNDFDIPLYLSHVVSAIHGKDRVESVDVTPLIDGKPNKSGTFHIPCDTVLLSVGLVPENELSKDAGIKINQTTNGPIVDSHLMTTEKGIFACGNVLHVHDLVDFVSAESRRAGQFASQYLDGGLNSNEIEIKPSKNVRYVCPQKVDSKTGSQIYLRTLVKKDDNVLKVVLFDKNEQREIKSIKLPHVQPSEMLNFLIKPEDIPTDTNDDAYLSVSVE